MKTECVSDLQLVCSLSSSYQGS